MKQGGGRGGRGGQKHRMPTFVNEGHYPEDLHLYNGSSLLDLRQTDQIASRTIMLKGPFLKCHIILGKANPVLYLFLRNFV